MTDLLNQKPRTVGEVRRLLGLLACYGRYIDLFAKIAQPFYHILKKAVSTSNQVPGSSKIVAANKDPPQLKLSTPATWQNHHQGALKKLIYTTASPPLLIYIFIHYLSIYLSYLSDFHQPFILHVDAPTKRLRCSLYQQTYGIWQGSLTKSGKKVSQFKVGNFSS